MGAIRKIIHVDMDAFFASVEQRDNLQYRGKAIAVGGSPAKRGAVAAANYEARKFGVHSAMPSRTAQQKCPQLLFVQPRFEVYRAVSEQIREIFCRYTDLVEPVALDEAYLDVTQNKCNTPSATLMAQDIKAAILQATGLTASAGVSVNKFLAKMATGINKPDGLSVILPEQASAFVEGLRIEKFHGVGDVTAAKMHELGIHSGIDLKRWSEAKLVEQFGKVGRFYYSIARAQDDRPVEPNRVRKSIGAETSYEPDLSDYALMLQELAKIAETVKQRLDEKQASGRTLTLKVKFADYQQITRSKTVMVPIREVEMIGGLARELFSTIDVESREVRLLGICLSNLDSVEKQYVQLSLL